MRFLQSYALNRIGVFLIVALGCGFTFSVVGPVAWGQDDVLSNPKVRAQWAGDLDGILDRRFVRVLVAPSRTNFFFDRKDLRGFDVEWMTAFEKQLNAGRKRSDKVRVVWVPTPFGELLPALKAGLGDIAIGGMTVLPSREHGIVFSDPYMTGVDEVIVHHRRLEGLKNLDDLAGRFITLRTHSSYEVHLQKISQGFSGRGLKPPVIRTIGTRLATEDILEMVNAGIVKLTVADRHLAESWAKVMPNLVVRTDLEISSGGTLAVAVRIGSPQLLESLNRFIRSNKKGTLLGNMLFTRYFNKSRWLKDPSADIEGATQEMVEVFRKYAALYEFDWMDLVAQAFRESRLDNGKRSRAGAVGIMQIKPSTAADSNVGIKNIEILENNIHAGVKYLAFVRDRYFSDSGISAFSRLNFSLAAYNAGPRRIVGARQTAADRGLDPNQWLDNVELVVAQTVGREPVDYVRDIRAYVIALGLYDENLKRDLDRESLKR
jgi:membrane-bound lytic murein transglycosylase MltF